jgi:hypothetical protein
MWESNNRVHAYFLNYCGDDVYGHYEALSALVFIPIDRNTNQIVSQVRLRTFLTLSTASGDSTVTPTLSWPSNFTEYYVNASVGDIPPEDYTNFMVTFFPGMVAASSGSIAIFPDYTGYGTSQPQLNRTLYWPESYMKASVIPYMRLEQYIANTTKSCTVMDARITICGVDDGSFAVPFVADAFRRYGVQTLTAFMGAGPMDVETMLMDTVAQFGANTVADMSPLRSVLPSTVYSFSSDSEGMLNANSGQQLVSSTFKDNLLYWMQSPEPLSSTQIMTLTPSDGRILVNEGFLTSMETAIANNVESVCVNNTNDQYNLLCDAILGASAWNYLRNESFVLVFPVRVCYSDSDEVYSTKHYPADMFDNARITRYTGASNFTYLQPQGNHSMARQLCAMDPILFYNLQGYMPNVMEDRPNYMFPLSSTEQQVCLGNGGGSGSNESISTTGSNASESVGSKTTATSNASSRMVTFVVIQVLFVFTYFGVVQM